MNFKKIFAVLVAAMFLFGIQADTSYAAKGGAKIRVSAPQTSTAVKNTAPAPKAEAPKTGPNNQEYAPSKKAADYNAQAPTSKANTMTPPNTGSRWGNTLRNIGLLAGGMMLGSLLGHMLGFGGIMGDILGVLVNILLFAGVIGLIMWAYRRLTRKDSPAPLRSAPTPRTSVPDIRPSSSDSNPFYDPKATADRYRKM